MLQNANNSWVVLSIVLQKATISTNSLFGTGFLANSVHGAPECANSKEALSMVLQNALIPKKLCPWCSNVLLCSENFAMVLQNVFYFEGILPMALQKAILSGWVHSCLFMLLQDAKKLLGNSPAGPACPWYSQQVLTILASSPTGLTELETLGGKEAEGLVEPW